MKLFSSLSSTSPSSKGEQKDPANEDTAEATVRRYKEAMRQHKKAMKELHLCADHFTKALEGVARSFQLLAEDTRTPVVIQSSGALLRGVAELRDGVVLEELREEIDHSLSARFAKMAAEQTELEESRRRTAKAEKALSDLQRQCTKLSARRDTDEKANMLYLAEAQRCDEQKMECARLAAEFEDALGEFAQHMGVLVYEDMTEVTTEVHKLLSHLSYQFRKCEENLKAHPVQKLVDITA